MAGRRQSHMFLGGMAAMIVSTGIGITALVDFLESWTEAERRAEEAQNRRAFESRVRACAEVWPLRASNYEACIDRARRLL